jgi:hypothetical protein
MDNPLFPIRPSQTVVPGAVLSIEPYFHEGAWVFDDPVVGLVKEPFVSGVTEMIDRLVAQIPNAAKGFRLQFSEKPFAGMQTALTWVRADPVEGNWYRADGVADEGWLCPTLFWYFASAPKTIYLGTGPK